MFTRKSYLILCLLILLAPSVLAQERVWNDALDRYEYICRRCDEWKKKLERNEAVPRDSLETMLGDLSVLKKNLQWAFGDMTPGQRRRYEAIRKQYVGGESLLESRAQLSEGDPLQPAVLPPGNDLAATENQSVPKVRPKGFAGAIVGFYPDLSYGVAAGVMWDKWGFLLKGRSNFDFTRYAYGCGSDKIADDGYVMWTDGSSCVKRHQITADLVFTPARPVSVCAGLGYGSRMLLWRDVDGNWARVRDRSVSGVALDASVLVRPFPWRGWNGLTIVAGISWLPARYIDGEVGLGWTF